MGWRGPGGRDGSPSLLLVAIGTAAIMAGGGGCSSRFGMFGMFGGGPPVAGAMTPAQSRELFGAAGDEPAHRAARLVARMTLQEKVDQLQTHAPAIPHLAIPAYDWWSESLHGVARNGTATVFPQAIALAATFDEELLRRVGEAIAAEARAKFDAAEARRLGADQYQGLTFFAPNLNIFRDPRWGRGQETYGEDPFLTGRLGIAYVRGMQGDDPRHLRTAAVAKHFAVHSGPEATRHRFDAQVDAHDLVDTYLPQFEAVVREGQVAGVMAAYNRVNGEPCVAHPRLLSPLLRGEWGFRGFVVGDCGAVQDLVRGHAVVADPVQAAALALRAGTDLDCGRDYRYLLKAVAAGLVTEQDLDRALVRLFSVRFRLGLFDPAAATPGGGGAPAAVVGSAPHLALAREAAQKSLVLLENDGLLPLGPRVRRIAVVGPVADNRDVLLGNYHGTPVAAVTLLAGIQAAARTRGVVVDHAPGVTLNGRSLARVREAVALALQADVVVAALGLSPRLEGEADDPDADNASGDRRDLGLPGAQPALLAALLRTGKPVVLLLTGGSAIALPPPVAAGAARPGAVVMAWYPGEQGGHAVADLLFGVTTPSGRLPITFYRSAGDLPPFTDYRMAGRTYRYFTGKPLYPFGHGLRYLPVAYGAAAVVSDPPSTTAAGPSAEPIKVQTDVENQGRQAIEEVVLVQITAHHRLPRDPLRTLVAFRRVRLQAGERQTVAFDLPRKAFSRIDAQGNRQPATGIWDVKVGDAPPITVDLADR